MTKMSMKVIPALTMIEDGPSPFELSFYGYEQYSGNKASQCGDRTVTGSI